MANNNKLHAATPKNVLLHESQIVHGNPYLASIFFVP